MEEQVGIWIDGAKAIIVSVSKNAYRLIEVESQVENRIKHQNEGDKGTWMGTQHIGDEKRFERRKQQQIERFFEEILTHLANVQELYLFGPGETKTMLAKKIAIENKIASKLKKTETADSMTQNQIIEQVKGFFKQQ